MTTVQRPSARTRLLQAADRVLFTNGIRATPVDDLLRQAEVSTATLYAQFGSKDGLLAEALRLRLADWRSVWDECIISAGDDQGRLLAVFDALEVYRGRRLPAARWCAFLATATELPDAPGEIGDVVTAETALLSERLRHLARPLAGPRAAELADDVVLAYNGTLAAFLRGTPASPIETGRRLARAAVGVYETA
ncbi:TetR/AcrR family transcriptional regulator [Arthrobacter sp. Sa2BUA2]|uniref:TetR/AcrR family transcriptional regulator n=1 Tax=Arthrobacter pullicola TaxID=2762224 RepID=A0ABR8YE77_9MICC|nr:TetR/AcrR family transcriptional regulator [Arthrobacter pullicola]MBD8042515.1 TetR/AcrR family transcriptional regulator [Arthrobacter pullicola]